jgi:hypothetical protein
VGAGNVKLPGSAILRFNAINCTVTTEISLNTKNYSKSNWQPNNSDHKRFK